MMNANYDMVVNKMKFKTNRDSYRRRFAFIPTVIKNKWVWLEFYFQYFSRYGYWIEGCEHLTNPDLWEENK